MSKTLFYLLCAVPLIGAADDRTAISGPVAGVVFDQPSGALRPVLGVPGAAYLGSSLATGIDAAGVSPDGSAALAVRGGSLFLVTHLKDPAPVWTSIDGAIGAADRFAWSSDTAAVYSSASGQAQILRQLSDNPAASPAIDLSGLPGPASALALAGDSLLIGVQSPGGGGVYLATADAAPQLLATATNPAAIIVAGTDLYFADHDTGQVWQVQSFREQPAVMLFADGIDTPAGLQLSAGRLFVAAAGSQTLVVYDVSSRAAVASVDLEFTPTRLDPLGSPSILLMNAVADPSQPLYIADTSGNPAVYFVPVGREQ